VGRQPLYLNFPAGGDDSQKQSFFWFHDHSHSHTEDNVYKGMVGLYPIYDAYPIADPSRHLDVGDETQGFRLPGVRINNPDGSFDVDFDIETVPSGRSHAQLARTSMRRGCSFGTRGKRSVSTPCFSSA
jgi:hypothetical protein